MNNIYETPSKYYFRLHHVRPRFKDDVENVLFFIANQICKIGCTNDKDFKTALNSAIKLFPGNSRKKNKTIENWRTEISSLFGLIQFKDGDCYPSKIAIQLSEDEDLIEFFRYFLYYFQYPGGHLKSHESLKLIRSNIRFKPAQYFLKTFLAGKKLNYLNFGISKEEATHCIFNDLRVTTGKRSPEEVISLIIDNREKGLDYDSGGDVTRYAGDILDYMVLANLVSLKPNGKYYLNNHQLEVIDSIIKNNKFYESLDRLYGLENLTAQDITTTNIGWFDYINEKIDSSIFKTDVISLLENYSDERDQIELPNESFINEVINKLRKDEQKPKNSKEIGDIGEAIVIEHEKNRLIKIDLSFKELLHWIKKIPETLAMGFDIQSLEGIGDKRRYIEVKTTLSMGKITANSFHMTPSEWSSASSHGDTYYVYRLTISKKEISLFIIQNPVSKYKNDLLSMTVREGVDITFSEKSGKYVELCR